MPIIGRTETSTAGWASRPIAPRRYHEEIGDKARLIARKAV